MQEWMIAMLVISIMLIIRDMAKTIFSRKSAGYRRTAVSCRRAILRKRGWRSMRHLFRNWQILSTGCLIGKII